MSVELRRNGLHLTGTPAVAGCDRKTPLSFVSHAHTDHIARHERTIATAATLRFMTHRLGPVRAPLPVPYNRPFELGSLMLELLPAGHILGSAQLRVIRSDGKRIVYTGDLNLVPSLTAEPAQVAECDTLVIESTFGHPRYRSRRRTRCWRRSRRGCARSSSAGRSPVLLGYPLGKSQEAMKYLADRGFRLVAHASIYEVAELYAELGVPIEARAPLRRQGGAGRGALLPAAPGARGSAVGAVAASDGGAHRLGAGSGGGVALRRGRGVPGLGPRGLPVAGAVREGHGGARGHHPPRLRRGAGAGAA